jgi:type II secretory pathway pseudopilin PulG
VPTPEPIQHYQPRSTFSTWLGIVLLFAVFGMIAFVMMKASARGDTYEKKRAKVRAEKLDAAQKENLTALTTYGWVDKNKGVVRIPVDQAMKLTLVELADKKPSVGGPIVAASPSAAPQTSPGPSAATSPSASPAANASTTPKPKAVTGPDSEAHNQPAAAINPPPAPPNTQPGPNASPAASVPSQSAKAPATPSPSAAPSAPGTPLPVRGKTP